MQRFSVLVAVLLFFIACSEKRPIVFQTDFGVKDGAVAAMKGVALSVDPNLQLYDLTHEIPTYSIWEAAYRLNQAVNFWPKGTVFVSVVDPGVGTKRRSVVLKTHSGHFIVSPDNGTLSLVASSLGIAEVREIDETIHWRSSPDTSYTFYGRDLYAYTAAKLASGKIGFKSVGKKLADSVVSIEFQQPILEKETIKGNIPVLDVQYGNVWTNIPDSLIRKAGWKTGDSILVQIKNMDSIYFHKKVVFKNTFGDVGEGKELGYINSLMNFSLALNKDNFAQRYNIYSGPLWTVILSS